jgi:FkbM family methyltransferase
MSRSIARSLSSVVNGATRWMKPSRRRITRALIAERLLQRVDVETATGTLSFHCSTARSLHDPQRFFENEPETIRWLDGLPAGDVLWDIGANIGIYALYAARIRGLRVLAFEPSASTYAALVRNVEMNGLADRLDTYCLAFDEESRLAHLNMANTGEGHSMHAFGRSETVQGAIKVAFRQSVPGFSIDDFCRFYSPPLPDHIKLDVDSIEESILKGARETLRRSVRSVLVEVDGTTRERGGVGIRRFLAGLGFREDAEWARADDARNVLFRKFN